MSQAHQLDIAPDSQSTPFYESGDFLSREPETLSVTGYGSTVVHRQKFTMDNDTEYIVTSSEVPNKQRDALGRIAITETAAWTTHDKGLNLSRMLSAAKLGFETSFVSPQQNLSRWGNLTRSAHNQLIIAEATAKQFDRNRDKAIVQGISRGAMHGFGVTDLAREHGVDVIYSDLIVPCFPQRFNPVVDGLDYLKLAPNEMHSLQALGALPLKILQNLPNTISRSPKMLFQHAKEVPTLLSGSAGAHAVTLPDDAYAHVVVFAGDVMSQGERWHKLLENHANITVENLSGGGHLSCAAPDCYAAWRSRLGKIAGAIREDPNVLEVTPSQLKAAVDAYDLAA